MKVSKLSVCVGLKKFIFHIKKYASIITMME